MKNKLSTIIMSREAIANFKEAFSSCESKPIILEPSNENPFNESRKVFNRRFDFVPSLIVQPRTTEHVAIATRYATDNDMMITVKSGGHDHEGECVATGKVLIDFVLMNKTDVSLSDYPAEKGAIKQISIQPGAKFKQIKKVLDSQHLGIPHGTCQSVAIAGYTMGGGWGPWTRMYGMGCERLMGATIVLGDGTVKYLGTSAFYNKDMATSENTEEAASKLLWAIRGGGGLSYGIVTEFFFEPFVLPDIAFSFHISYDMLDVFKKIKATAVIEAWESIIAPGRNKQLIGTNLKVIAKQVASKTAVSKNAVLDWTLNGHFGGTREELELMMREWGVYLIKLIENDPDFTSIEKQQMASLVIEGLKDKFNQVTNDSHILAFFKDDINGYPFTFESWDRYSATAKENGLSLETDCPAPHKITSRMPTSSWDDKSREQLVCSLQSTLLKGIEGTNISSYITLGAIQGDFYATQEARDQSALKCAFPFQARPFTIQYQTWWDMPTESKDDCKCEMDSSTLAKIIPTRFYANRALDWMEECRDFTINETDGSFISFKDDAVPTKNYFVENYNDLIAIKLAYSEDKKCIFRSRKTIL